MRTLTRLALAIGITAAAILIPAAPAAAATVTGSHDKVYSNANGTTLGLVEFDFVAELDTFGLTIEFVVRLTNSPHVQQVRFRPRVFCHRDQHDKIIDKLLITHGIVALNGASESSPFYGYNEYWFGGVSNPAYDCNVIKVSYNVTWVGNSGTEYKFTQDIYKRF